ncbi:hypothetical protein DXG03_009497 [Asterophora parasitica]|uniref:Uncharacterized protein n=1 Tax=Asterophora parasitica TaxID=117018 RepID=A0A9P7G4D6_9AGAR|nr:hypothetical protein DXG03_009497 [Asterophora parasitica]
MTAQRYYEISRRHLAGHLDRTFIVSWAGNRLIYLGESAAMDDLPPGVLTDAELSLLKPKSPQSRNEHSESESAYTEPQEQCGDGALQEEDEGFMGGCVSNSDDDSNYRAHGWVEVLQARDPNHRNYQTLNIYREYEPYMTLPQAPDDIIHFFWCTLRSSRGGCWVFAKDKNDYDSTADRRALTGLVDIHLPTPLTHEELYGGSFVLRNLTTQEYVRGDAIRDLWNTSDLSCVSGSSTRSL